MDFESLQILQILVKIIDYNKQSGLIIGYKDSNGKIKKVNISSYVINTSRYLYKKDTLVMLSTWDFIFTKDIDGISLPDTFPTEYINFNGKSKKIEYSSDGYVLNKLEYLGEDKICTVKKSEEISHLHDFDDVFERADFDRLRNNMDFIGSTLKDILYKGIENWIDS